MADCSHYLLENGVVTHNTGVYYSATNIWIMGREQEKDGDELIGYTFSINIDKSRYVKEKSKLKLTVTFDGGVDKYSGIFDLAIDAGYIISMPGGWYRFSSEDDDVKHRRKDMEKPALMEKIVNMEKFQQFVKDKYQLSAPKTLEEMMAEDDEGQEILLEDTSPEPVSKIEKIKKNKKAAAE